MNLEKYGLLQGIIPYLHGGTVEIHNETTRVTCFRLPF